MIKRTLTRLLSGIDKANPNGTNQYLNQLQEVLWKEYERTLLQEDILWYQRARYKWLQFEDRNTKFFHAATLVRKKRNKVEVLTDDESNRIIDKAELRDLATNYFKSLYLKDGQVDFNNHPIRDVFSKLDNDCIKDIDKEITSEEIKGTIFSMGALKAPGPNGFHAMFFQG